MKKILLCMILFGLLANFCFAGCWMHPEGKFVRWERPTTIKLNGVNYFDPNHTDEDLYSAGYRYVENTPECPIWEMFYDYEGLEVYQICVETNVVDIPIDGETKQAAFIFKNLLTSYFGVGAETNRTIGVKFVADFFTAKVLAGTITPTEIAHSIILEKYFSVLSVSPYNPSKGTTWEFPFDLETAVADVTRRYYIDSLGIKHYLE